MKIKFLPAVLFILVNITFSQTQIPTLDKPLFIKNWMYAGPFETGAREGTVDALYPLGYDPGDNDYTSGFAENAKVEWKNISSSGDGNVSLKITNAPWQVLNEGWGIVGVNYVTYVKGTFYSDKKYKAKIITKQVRSINLNERNILADFYSLNRWDPPVLIESGENHVVVTLNSYSDSIGFYFSVQPDSDNIRIIENDITFPDAIEGQSCDSWIGIPLVNCTDEWLNNISLTIGGNEYYSSTRLDNINILPLCVNKVALKLKSNKQFPPVTGDKDKNNIELPVKVEFGSQIIKQTTIKIPLKKQSEDRRETFLSKIDNSVQFYAVKEPTNYNPSQNYGLIFSLHGAGVYALGQVGAYAPRDWAFVVAPTNRREYGFNWHEEGRIDAMEVLDIVKQKYKIDTTRIMLTGHSMGGHGVWHIGTTYSDKFAAIASACGWMSIDLYFPMFLTKYNTFAPPGLKYIWEKGFAPDRPQLYLNNLYNTPALILVAGADDNVPPVHGRMFTEEMTKLGMHPELHDLPGRQHWFDDDTVRPGADATDAQFFEDFYQGKVLNPYPDTVKFVMGDPAIKNDMYWVKITETEKYLEPATIMAINQNDEKFIVESKNVNGFELKCKNKSTRGINIDWNGRISNIQSDENGIIKVKTKIEPNNIGRLNKNLISGPMKRVYMKPCVIVIGSNTNDKTFKSYIQVARQEALSWWYIANGNIDIITDKQASDFNLNEKNIILIGTVEDNAILADKIKNTPFTISSEGIKIGEELIATGENSLKFVYPDITNPDKLILFSTGTSSKYAILSEAYSPFSVFSALPDWMVFDENVREHGLAGVKAAGYFDMNWRFDENLSYY